MRLGLISAVALVAASCAHVSKSGPQAGTSASTVVATVGGAKIRYKAIVKKVGPKLARLRANYLIEKRKVEAQTLSEIIEEKLLAAAAKKRGVTVERLIELEVTSKIGKPSEEEVQKIFKQASARLPLPLKVLRPRIEQVLKMRASMEARKKFIARLEVASKVNKSLPMEPIPSVEIPEAGNPYQGPKDAPVKLVVFSDFECPFCSRVVPTLHKLLKKYTGKIRIAFRDFPLSFHANARRAAEAAQCANDQGKFWPYHDRLFANQDKLTEKDLIDHAKAIQLNSDQLASCLKSGKYKKEVSDDIEAGSKLGVTGTPAVFVNGVMLSGAQPYNVFADLVDAFLAAKQGK